jgi:small-conductance mechanosensitive channel
MSSLPYVRGEGADPSLIPLDSLRAPVRPGMQSQSSFDSATSNPNPPAHHIHQHDPNNPHFYEGMQPGFEGEQSYESNGHQRGKDSKGSVQYDTLVDKDKNPYLAEKYSTHPQNDYPPQQSKSGGGHHHYHHHHVDEDGEEWDSSGDETDDFDWNTDDSDNDDDEREEIDNKGKRVIRAKRGRRVWLWLMRLARPVRIFVFGLLGTGIAMVPFIVTTAAFKNNPVRPQVQTWSIWIAIIWAAACGTFLVMDWIPPIVLKVGVAFYGKAPPAFKTYVEVFIAIMIWIKLVLCITWAWISLGGILAVEFPGQAHPPYFKWILLTIKALFASGIILVAEKFALQLVAINFHKVSLKERLETNQSALRALDRLADSKYLASGVNSKRQTGIWGQKFGFGSRPQSPSANVALGHHKNASQTGGYFGNSAARDGSPLQEQQHGNSGGTGTPKGKKGTKTPKQLDEKEMRKQNFASQLTDALQTATMKDSKLYRNKKMLSARRLAKKLFNAVGHHRTTLVAEDFEPFFDSFEEAREAFKHFDADGNGDVSKQEFRDGVQRIFRERRALATSLKDASSAVQKLDGVLLGVALVIMIFIWLLIFNGDNTVANIAPLSTFVVGFSFIFGNSAKTLFESMVFIFATHPYDVGDLVCVDENFMFVVEFGLISTTFRTVYNETIVAPNALLSSQKMIFNCRRSNNQWEVTMIQVGYDSTLLEMIDELRSRMRTYVKEHDREWGGGMEINLNTIESQTNSIELVIAMEHKGNWQDWGQRWSRRTQLMRQLKEELESLGISYQLPKQPVSFTLKPGQSPHAPKGPQFLSSSGSNNTFLPVGGVGKLQLTKADQLAALKKK